MCSGCWRNLMTYTHLLGMFAAQDSNGGAADEATMLKGEIARLRRELDVQRRQHQQTLERFGTLAANMPPPTNKPTKGLHIPLPSNQPKEC